MLEAGAQQMVLPGRAPAAPCPTPGSADGGKCNTGPGKTGGGWTAAPDAPDVLWSGHSGEKGAEGPTRHGCANSGPSTSQTRTPGASVGFYKVCS